MPAARSTCTTRSSACGAETWRPGGRSPRGAGCNRQAAYPTHRLGSPGHIVCFTTDLDSAWEGAYFVLNQIRVGGYAARAFDEMFPRELGLPGEETVGPGGFSLTARTIPVVLDDCRAIERRAPR